MKDHFIKADLKTRGWTDSLIRRFLPLPDSTAPNPKYRKAGSPMKLYSCKRVTRIEATKKFRAAKQQAEARQAAAQKAVETKRKKISEFVESMVIEVPLIEKEKLIETARCHFYSLDYKSNVSPAVERMCVNYLRQCETEYESQLRHISGKAGADDAYFEIKEMVLCAIADTYEWLTDECTRQIEELSRKRWTVM